MNYNETERMGWIAPFLTEMGVALLATATT